MSLLKTLSILLLIAVSSEGWAKAQGSYYGGLKAGSFLTDRDNLDNAFPLGFRYGYDYGRNWSLEGDFLTGEFEENVDGKRTKLDIDTLSLQVTYRSPATIYYIIRFGVVDKEIEASLVSDSEKVDQIGLIFGTGAGYRLTDESSLELEFTVLESDTDFVGLTIQTELF